MKNLFISDLDQKDVNHFTSNCGLKIRKVIDKPFKKVCNLATNVNIIKMEDNHLSDEAYFESLTTDYVSLDKYNLVKGKNNIILERYPELKKDESYIFVCNHTCPEDIETVLNIIDRNAYLVLGSVDSLKYNPEMYLSWMNGMIPFDILDNKQRKELIPKMTRVLKSNSILIFPEGSHNYSPNNLINGLFDGPVNLSLQTTKKIGIVTLIRDQKQNISYIDVSNPVDFNNFNVKQPTDVTDEKRYVNQLTACVRDRMATAVYYIMLRHFMMVTRSSNDQYENKVRDEKVIDAFKQLKWNKDIFDAEYLVKKNEDERKYEEVVKTMSNLRLNNKVLNSTGVNIKEYVKLANDLENKCTEEAMRRYYYKEI